MPSLLAFITVFSDVHAQELPQPEVADYLITPGSYSYTQDGVDESFLVEDGSEHTNNTVKAVMSTLSESGGIVTFFIPMIDELGLREEDDEAGFTGEVEVTAELWSSGSCWSLIVNTDDGASGLDELDVEIDAAGNVSVVSNTAPHWSRAAEVKALLYEIEHWAPAYLPPGVPLQQLEQVLEAELVGAP